MWVYDISEMDNEKCDVSEMDNKMVNASEMDNRRFNAIRGVVRLIKAQITSFNPTDTNLSHYYAPFSNFIFMLI